MVTHIIAQVAMIGTSIKTKGLIKKLRIVLPTTPWAALLLLIPGLPWVKPDWMGFPQKPKDWQRALRHVQYA
jgi:hypothetical protein